MSGVLESYETVFGAASNASVYRAPGRVNLIGEHTDYNDGYVLPTPIGRYIYTAVALRTDNQVHLYACDFDESVSFTLDEITYDPEHLWANYVKGVIKVLQDRDISLNGFNMAIEGHIPIGAGLSSSAALETAVFRALKGLNGFDMDPIDAAYLCKEAENSFVGVQCGVMDQFVSMMGVQGKALFIDCKTNDSHNIPLDSDYQVVIVNSMKSRELADSAYNERRAQCTEAASIIGEHVPGVNSLRDVTPENLLENWQRMPPLIAKRARHVVTENQRVLDSVEFLERGDIAGFGDLMYDSHLSLKDDYDVSCRELNVLVDATLELDYVAGARMTGAGFGGCTVNLVEKGYLDEFTEYVTSKYLRSTAKRGQVYLA
jgi:galactokinase